jgi:DNA polymerase-3 subunit epsilon
MRKFQPSYKSPDYKENLSKINLNSIIIPDIKERIIIIDTVTTGSNPKENNIMEIGCLEMIGGKITGLEFHAFLHPRYTINEITKQKTNLSSNFYEEYYKDAYASDHKVLEQFKNFVNQSVIVAHNASKDMEFINNEFIFHKINIFPKKKFFCTLNIFRQMFPDISRGICSLSKCCEYLDIKLPNKNNHSAIYDSFMVAKLMSKLFDIKEQVLENKNININNFSINRNNSNYNNYSNLNRQLSFNNSFNSENRNFNNHNNENYQINNDFNKGINYNNSNINKNNIKLIEEENKNIFSLKEQNKNNKNDINFKKINSVNVISSSNNYINIFNKKSDENKKDLNLNDDGNNDIKLLNNKRKLDFKDLIQNLKNKVNPKNNDTKNGFNKNDIDLNANDFNIINKLIKEK